jgi:hypothetical protein
MAAHADWYKFRVETHGPFMVLLRAVAVAGVEVKWTGMTPRPGEAAPPWL